MNQDTLFQLVRYALLALGGFLTGRGYLSNEQLELVGGAAAICLPAIWGVWVKWNTTPVSNAVIQAKDVPSVNGATGQTIPPPSRSERGR